MTRLMIKTAGEMKIMAEGGKKLGRIRDALGAAVRPGMTTAKLDALADRLIAQAGGEAAFKRVSGYKHATCISVNEEVVHGVPGERKLVVGDVVAIDVGIVYRGWNTDTSTTVIVGSGSKTQNGKAVKFLEVGKLALRRAIDQARPGKRVMDISRAMQTVVEGAGFSVVRALTGHGVGRELHEEPAVPCFVIGKYEHSIRLVSGMVLAIEVMYNMGGEGVVYKSGDGWTIATADGKISGLFEETVAVTRKGPVVLT